MLTEKECRVIGCLIEKELTTPDYYPLTLNSLTAACNQKSNRFPVVSYDEPLVQTILDDLYKKKFVLKIPNVSNRTIKYLHNLPAHFSLAPQEVAILCELMLRGNQTPGELWTHGERLSSFSSLEEVVDWLQKLSSRETPLVVMLPRQTGMKENRYAHLLSGNPLANEAPAAPSPQERIEALEKEVTELRKSLEEMKQAFQDFKAQF